MHTSRGVYAWRNLSPKLQGVAYQELENLHKLGGVCYQGWQGVSGDLGLALFDGVFQAPDSAVESGLAIGLAGATVARTDASVSNYLKMARRHCRRNHSERGAQELENLQLGGVCYQG